MLQPSPLTPGEKEAAGAMWVSLKETLGKFAVQAQETPQPDECMSCAACNDCNECHERVHVSPVHCNDCNE